MINNVRKVFVLTVAFISCFAVYVILEYIIKADNVKHQQEEAAMKREMFGLGASMYRSQVANMYGDSILPPVDSVFILEVYDYNDSLGRHIQQAMEEDF